MWKLLGIDFEAQDEDPLTTMPTEIGAVLVQYDEADRGEYAKESDLSAILYSRHLPYKPQSEKVIELTGITQEQLEVEGVDPVRVFKDKLFPLMEQADFILAHNTRYDKRLFDSFCKRFNLNPPEKTWICTYQEVPYPDKYTCKKLAHLALDHGILMDGRVLHRATADVELMLELVAHYKFSTILKYAQTPWVFIKVEVPAPWNDGGKGKDLAKKMGFGWQNARGTEEPFFDKTWVKRVKEDQLEAALSCMPGYRVVEVKGTL